MLKLSIIVFIFLTLSFLGIAIKILLKKGGKLEGTCASQNPLINKKGEDCSYCGKPANLCKNRN